jgi:RHS repeat-associated protein
VVWPCDLDQEMQRETLPGLAQFLVERRVVGGLAEKRGPSHRLMEDGVDKAGIRTSRPPRHIAPFNSSTERPPRKPNPTPLPLYGRIVEQQWVNTATGTAADDIKYSYDRDGNVLTRNNLAFSNDNETYSYNGLNQLISFTRGTETQSWTLDAAGNWSSFTTSGTTQTRTSNLQNQITTISGATTPTYDYNGNTLTDDNGTQYTYDAWNRMVKAVTAGGSTEIDAYDALGRRITVTLNSLPTDYYYSSSGQVLEEIQYLTGGESITDNIWSPVYVNALFERIINGTPYAVQQDADWNVTTVTKSVINPNTYQYYQQVQEGFVYDPYGKAGTPYLNMPYLFQGGRSDSTTGLYQFGVRDLSPSLGRWMEQDPVRYAGGDSNLYGFLGENPPNATDPSGMKGNGQVILTWQDKPAGGVFFPLPDPINGNPSGSTIVTIGEPGFWESLIPIWGSGRSAINAFQEGHWAWGLFYAGLAASDAFFVGTLITASSELALKGGLKACQVGLLNFIKDEAGAVDPNKLFHIFGPAKHKLGTLVTEFGSELQAYEAIEKAIDAAVSQKGITGLFEETVQVGTQQVTVRGNVINGVVHIGSAWKP